MRYKRRALLHSILVCASLTLARPCTVLGQTPAPPAPTPPLPTSVAAAAAAPPLEKADAAPETYATVLNDERDRAIKLKKQGALTTAATASANQALKAVAATNAPTTAPDGFASRIHSTFQDYLNLLAFAVNKVDESKDGQSLIIRLNPLRSGPQLVAATLTLSKPGVYQPILDAVPVASQPSVQQAIGKQLSDLEDATVAVSYSLSTKECGFAKPTGRCFGRDARAYRTLIEDLLGVAADPGTPEAKAVIQGLQDRLRKLSPRPELENVAIRDFADPKTARDLIEQLGRLQAAGTLLEQDFYSKAGFGVLENLIDNQPQLSVTAAYRSLGHFEGPDEWNAGLALQWGQYNLNRLRSESRGTPADAAALLKKWDAATVGDGKFVLSVNYKHRSPYSLPTLEVGGTAVQGYTPVQQPGSAELSARLQWGTKIDQKVAGKKPRVDLLLEGLRTWNDDVRTTNRWVGTATLTIPAGDSLSIPISLNYANKPEFLAQQSKQLGAHLGITYRIPGLSPAQ